MKATILILQFLNSTKIYQLKANNSRKSYTLCFGIVSIGFAVNNMKKQD